MALLLVLLTAILAFSLASTDQCVSSPGSNIDLFLRSHKNASGDWIITVDTRRLTTKDNPREFSVNVQHETRICGRYEIEEHVSMAFVYSSLHDTSMPGTIEPSTTSPTTATLSTTTATPSTATPSTATTTAPSTSTPKSCPRSGYQRFPQFSCYKAFNQRKTWREAREQCMRDGGDLMVMESEREREDVYIPLYENLDWGGWPWVGVYIPQDGHGWTTVKGEPVLSTLWRTREPEKNPAWKCANANPDGELGNHNCAYNWTFICEIQI